MAQRLAHQVMFALLPSNSLGLWLLQPSLIHCGYGTLVSFKPPKSLLLLLSLPWHYPRFLYSISRTRAPVPALPFASLWPLFLCSYWTQLVLFSTLPWNSPGSVSHDNLKFTGPLFPVLPLKWPGLLQHWSFYCATLKEKNLEFVDVLIWITSASQALFDSMHFSDKSESEMLLT